MKNKILILCMLFSTSVYAEQFQANIHLVRTNSDLDEQVTWFQLDGVTNVAGCVNSSVYGGPNLTMMAIKSTEKEMQSSLLTAYAANIPLHVILNTDSTYYLKGICRATSLTLIR